MTGFMRAIEGVQEKEKEEERQSKLTKESEFFNGERRATTFDISLLWAPLSEKWSLVVIITPDTNNYGSLSFKDEVNYVTAHFVNL